MEQQASATPANSSAPEVNLDGLWLDYVRSGRWQIEPSILVPHRRLTAEEFQRVRSEEAIQKAERRFQAAQKAAFSVYATQLNQKGMSKADKLVNELRAFLSANPFSPGVYSISFTPPEMDAGESDVVFRFCRSNSYRPNVGPDISTLQKPQPVSVETHSAPVETKVDDVKQLEADLAKNLVLAESDQLTAPSHNDRKVPDDGPTTVTNDLDFKQLAFIATSPSSYTFCYFPALQSDDITFSAMVIRGETVQLEGPWIEKVANRYIPLLPEQLYRPRALRDGRLHHITLFHPLSSSAISKSKLEVGFELRTQMQLTDSAQYAEQFLHELISFAWRHSLPLSTSAYRIAPRIVDHSFVFSIDESKVDLTAEELTAHGIGRLALVTDRVSSNSQAVQEPRANKPLVVQGAGTFPCSFIPQLGRGSSQPELKSVEFVANRVASITEVKYIIPLVYCKDKPPSIVVYAESFYACVTWPAWQSLVNNYGMKPNLHITLGFHNQDVHSGSKAAEDSLIVHG